MEDSSEQQWSWALAVGGVLALYGYAASATGCQHPRQHPVQDPAPVAASDGRRPAHPPQQANLAYILDFGAGSLVRPRKSKVPDQQHIKSASDV
jgi:hypothetical protein